MATRIASTDAALAAVSLHHGQSFGGQVKSLAVPSQPSLPTSQTPPPPSFTRSQQVSNLSIVGQIVADWLGCSASSKFAADLSLCSLQLANRRRSGASAANATVAENGRAATWSEIENKKVANNQ